MTPAEACRAAAALIEQRGLAKKKPVEEDGSLCLSGALHAAFCGGKYLWGRDSWQLHYATSDWEAVLKAVQSVLTERNFRRHFTRWNDLPATTAAEAVQLLLEAAGKLE
jgi:hypothetical protein